MCSATSSAVITNSGSLNIGTTITPTSCTGGASGGAAVTVNGGTAPFTYAWSNGNTTTAITGVVAATYQVTVADHSGCSGTASAVVSAGIQLSLSAASTDAQCFNSVNGSASVNVTTGTAPYQYGWNNSSTTDTITGLAAGNYTVTVTDANNCQATISVAINQPTSINLNVLTSQPACAGLSSGSAEIHASGGSPSYSYLWSNGSTSLSIGALAAGGYAITVTDANLCTAVSNFNILNPVPVTATFSVINDSCFGNTNGTLTVIPAGGSAPYTFLWTGNSTTTTITGLASGNYTVTITDNANCSATGSSVISQPNPIISIDTSTPANPNQSNGSASVSSISGGTSPYVVTWSTNQTGVAITGLATGIYTATITDNNGCQKTDHVTVGVAVGIETVAGELSFTIYPNPAQNEVTIEAGNLNKETILVLQDMPGQQLLTKNIGNTPNILNVEAYANGVYFIELRQDGKSVVKKFVINR